MYRGSIVALVTPMNEDNTLNWGALAKLVDWHLEQGTHGIVAMGTTGESATLGMEEHLDVIRRVVTQVNGQVPVIAGTGANSIHEAVELTQGAKDAKADACLLVTPYYNKPTQEGLFLFHQYIAQQVNIPQILYNVPGRTAVDMLPETVARLAGIDNIIGIKEATGDMQRLQQIQALVNDQFMLLSGDDATAVDFMAIGGHGEISVTANIAPKAVAQMCEFALAGDIEQARKIDSTLASLHEALFVESNPIPVKWALTQMARIPEGIRLPMTPLSTQYHDQLQTALIEAGVL